MNDVDELVRDFYVRAVEREADPPITDRPAMRFRKRSRTLLVASFAVLALGSGVAVAATDESVSNLAVQVVSVFRDSDADERPSDAAQSEFEDLNEGLATAPPRARALGTLEVSKGRTLMDSSNGEVGLEGSVVPTTGGGVCLRNETRVVNYPRTSTSGCSRVLTPENPIVFVGNISDIAFTLFGVARSDVDRVALRFGDERIDLPMKNGSFAWIADDPNDFPDSIEAYRGSALKDYAYGSLMKSQPQSIDEFHRMYPEM